MDRRRAEPVVEVSYASTRALERRAMWAAHPVRCVLPFFVVATLGATAVQRGGESLLVFGVSGGVGLVAAVVASLYRQQEQRGMSALAAVTFSSAGLSVDRGDRQQSYSWSGVRSVAHRGGFWVFRLESGGSQVVPGSAFDDDQAAALTGLVRSRGLLRT